MRIVVACMLLVGHIRGPQELTCKRCRGYPATTLQRRSYVLVIGGPKMPTVGSRSLGTKLGEAGVVILIHCAIMLLKILNVYCVK